MKIGIDGNMWYCSNGLSLPEHNAKFSFKRTLREAIVDYNKTFKEQNDCPETLKGYLNYTPEQYLTETCE